MRVTPCTVGKGFWSSVCSFTQLGVGMKDVNVLLESCTAMLTSSLWSEQTTQQMPVWSILTDWTGQDECNAAPS